MGKSLSRRQPRRREPRPTVSIEGVARHVERVRDGAGRVFTIRAFTDGDEIRVWVSPTALAGMGSIGRLEGRRVRVTGAIWYHDGVQPSLSIVEPAQLAVERRDRARSAPATNA